MQPTAEEMSRNLSADLAALHRHLAQMRSAKLGQAWPFALNVIRLAEEALPAAVHRAEVAEVRVKELEGRCEALVAEAQHYHDVLAAEQVYGLGLMNELQVLRAA